MQRLKYLTQNGDVAGLGLQQFRGIASIEPRQEPHGMLAFAEDDEEHISPGSVLEHLWDLCSYGTDVHRGDAPPGLHLLLHGTAPLCGYGRRGLLAYALRCFATQGTVRLAPLPIPGVDAHLPGGFHPVPLLNCLYDLLTRLA